MDDKKITFDDLKSIKEQMDSIKSSGFSEIKVIQNDLLKDGTPILMLSKNDYEEFFKK